MLSFIVENMIYKGNTTTMISFGKSIRTQSATLPQSGNETPNEQEVGK